MDRDSSSWRRHWNKSLLIIQHSKLFGTSELSSSSSYSRAYSSSCRWWKWGPSFIKFNNSIDSWPFKRVTVGGHRKRFLVALTQQIQWFMNWPLSCFKTKKTTTFVSDRRGGDRQRESSVWINTVKFIIHRVPQTMGADAWLSSLRFYLVCLPSLGTRSSLAMISRDGL